MKEIWLLQHFSYDFDGNFVFSVFLQFGCNVIYCKSAYKRISLLFVFLCIPGV